MALDWPYTMETTRHSRKTYWTGTLRVQGRGVDQEQPEKKHCRMGNAKGWEKLERDKRTSLR